MNIDNCSYSTRNKNLCRFNLDCRNSVKTNQVHAPCPAPGENKTLGCDTNGNSENCQLYLCNYEKYAQMNKSIFDRNLENA